MPYGTYISAEGALAQTRRLETIANNLANVNTVGFKRDQTVLQARFAEAIEQGLAQHGAGTINDVGGGVMVEETLTDYSPGTFKRTEVQTDFAIRGDGYFVIDQDGQQLLTRAGNFLRTASGALVTQQGNSVLGADGAPVVIDPGIVDVQATPDGGIQQGGAVTLLAMVRPIVPGQLVKVGENLFRPLGETLPLVPGERRVEQGYLEMSGVNPVTELVAMTESQRAFEANINMIRNQDQMVGSLLSRLLKAS